MNMLFSEGERVKRQKKWEVKGRSRGSPFLYFPLCPGLFSTLTPIERRAVNRLLAFLPITYGYWQCKYSLTELLNSFVCTPRQLQSDVNTSPLILKQTSQLTWPFTLNYLPPPQALRFSHRDRQEMQGNGDEAQGTIGRRKITGEAQSRPFSPSRLPLRANLHHEKDVWVRGSSTLILNKFSWKNRWKLRIFNVASSQLTNLSFPLFPRP